MAIVINPEAYYDTIEAAPLVSRERKTLETLRVRGGGPMYSKRGRTVLYKGADLISWLDGARIENTAQGGDRRPGAGRKTRTAAEVSP